MENLEFEKCAVCGEEATFIDTTLTGLIFYCEAHGTVKGLTRGIPESSSDDKAESTRMATDEPGQKCVFCERPVEEGNTCQPCVNELMT